MKSREERRLYFRQYYQKNGKIQYKKSREALRERKLKTLALLKDYYQNLMNEHYGK